MHQDPEHEDYDDDEYKYYPEDNQSIPYSFDWNTWELWLSDVLKDIIQQENNDTTWTFTFPYYTSKKTTNNKSTNNEQDKFVYFGKNQYDETIWKKKFFKMNHFNQHYQNHFMAHAAHIVRQPQYYRSLFDILN